MSRWLFDLGNSRLKAARLGDDGRMGEVIALGHDESAFADALHGLLAAGGRGGSACLASVASPVLTARVVEILAAHFRTVSLVRTQRRFAGVRVAYAEPGRLGVDRFLAMIGAHARQPGRQLIVGVGTALTIDLLAAGGEHGGGLIAPSPRLMRQALHHAAAQLPAEGGEVGDFAADTADALASGCDGAAVGLIERSLRQAALDGAGEPALVLHGGGADALLAQLPQAVHAPSLVLEGLARWAMAGSVPDGLAHSRIAAC